ncbi:response regulator receiver modulated metal-depenent phosphohydrolase [Paractinoplanes deccanensis]|uniref:Response regulator receiver modulated metal-depenent phosphohydrolase n=1 Tax=Paractinoplanes deccanensis TaxID=113561 RepID=A0ABQ3Y4P2_9ACTN|nr:response regulator [Actinoplanes deccanensis]GID74954.1 response regulator receiver modulated metal-depenent phosphohydrolase [Actinoplanes deccanensis]
MAERILMVDDEPRILDGLRRTLHGRYQIDPATSGAEGLTRIAEVPEPYSVVVSDMKMPGMDGAEFLARARVASPDSVQIILSGQAELTSTIAAVNDGNLFRFLTKPCDPADLTRALDAALEQHRLVMAERELLQRTLDGAVELLTDLMKATNPLAASRTERLRVLVDAIAPPEAWEPRIAAMLGQVGLMAIPEPVLARVRSGEELDPENLELFRSHPRLAYDLIRRIPRLERVAGWVAEQPVVFGPEPPEGMDEDQAPYATAVAFLVGVDGGRPPVTAAADLTGYPKQLVDRILKVYAAAQVRKPRRVTGAELMVGMVVDQDVLTTNGLVLIRQGEVLSESMAIRLRHFASGVGLVEPIAVLV